MGSAWLYPFTIVAGILQAAGAVRNAQLSPDISRAVGASGL
jgi:hypothetical protein